MNRELQWKYLDHLKRQLYLKEEIHTKLLISMISNNTLPPTLRILSSYIKNKKPRRSSLTQQRNRCLYTGRIHMIISHTKQSRFVFRRFNGLGEIPGYRRASW